MIFVFGSNLSGIHGAGAARFAKLQHGAVWGEGIGLHGNSYAIPTKNRRIFTLHLEDIRIHVDDFLVCAESNPNLTFQVTQIGCGLAGYTAEQIAPMFLDAPLNCQFDTAWKSILGDKFTYWGRAHRMSDQTNTGKINRVEIIDEEGRSYTRYLQAGEKVELSLQDDGRTLKVFIK